MKFHYNVKCGKSNEFDILLWHACLTLKDSNYAYLLHRKIIPQQKPIFSQTTKSLCKQNYYGATKVFYAHRTSNFITTHSVPEISENKIFNKARARFKKIF